MHLRAADSVPLTRMLELEARLEKAQQENERLREEAVEAKVRAAIQAATQQAAVSDEQLSALQARLEATHASKLLTDDEFFALEDLCADFAELHSTVGSVTKEMMAFEPVAKLHKLVVLSEKMDSDTGFCRQARRKFVLREYIK